MRKETSQAINTLAGTAGYWVGWNFSLLLKLLAVLLICGTTIYAAFHGRAPFALDHQYSAPMTIWEFGFISLGWAIFGFSAGGDFAKSMLRRRTP